MHLPFNPVIFNGPFAVVCISQRDSATRFVHVDTEQLPRLTGERWVISRGRSGIEYAVSSHENPAERRWMHRVLVDAPADREVDHVSRDGLDNRLSNLRLATRSENMQNLGIRRDNTSGARGVSWDKRAQAWGASMEIKGRRFHLGYFGNIDDADKCVRSYRARYMPFSSDARTETDECGALPDGHVRGVDHPHAKLTPESVHEIRASLDTISALSRRFGVSRAAIRNVRARKAWGHV